MKLPISPLDVVGMGSKMAREVINASDKGVKISDKLKGKGLGAVNHAIELKKVLELVQGKFIGLKEPINLVLKILEDNSLKELIQGKLKVSEQKLNELVSKFTSEREEIKNLELSLHQGFIVGNADVIVKDNSYKISFKINEIHIKLGSMAKEVCFILDDIPAVETKNMFKKIMLKVAVPLMRSLHGEGKIYDHLLNDIDGVSVNGNIVTVDLNKVSALKQVMEAEMLGLNIIDFIRVDKVEIGEGELVLRGGLRVPEKVVK